MKRIYLDNAATTPIDRRVLRAMMPYFKSVYGNPSSLHKEGTLAKETINKARLSIANNLGCDEDEIFFTSGASESNSWVSKVYGCNFNDTVHDSISMANDNKKREIKAISLINSETGNLSFFENGVHLDCTQAIGKTEINLHSFNCKTASFSGHKFGAPKGIGILYIARDCQKDFVPLIYGHQQNGLRGGTENVAGIVGMAKALDLALKDKKGNKKILELQTIIEKHLNRKGLHYDASFGIINIIFKRLNSQSAVNIFNQYGVAISAGSACNSGSDEPSKALLFYGYSKEDALKTIRISLGKQNTSREIKKFLKVLDTIIDKYDCL